jgi:hypothetical protein
MGEVGPKVRIPRKILARKLNHFSSDDILWWSLYRQLQKYSSLNLDEQNSVRRNRGLRKDQSGVIPW